MRNGYIYFLFLDDCCNIGLSIHVWLGRFVDFYIQIPNPNHLSLLVVIMNFNMTFKKSYLKKLSKFDIKYWHSINFNNVKCQEIKIPNSQEISIQHARGIWNSRTN